MLKHIGCVWPLVSVWLCIRQLNSKKKVKVCSLHSRSQIPYEENDISRIKIPLIELETHNGEYLYLGHMTRARQMDHVIGPSH